MKKIFFAILFAVLVLAVVSVSVAANDNIVVKLDGMEIAFDIQPTIKEGTTLVPVRAIFEALNATVEWDDSTKTVTSTRNGVTVKMQINNKKMTVGNKTVDLNYPAIIIGGRTLVPVRAISEAFGCKVGWDGKVKIVSIISDFNNYTMLYAPNGRSRAFPNKEVNANLKVGWYRDAELKDNITDEQIYDKLKLRAESSAFSCAATAIRNMLKNPSTMKILDQEIIANDNYLRYVVKMEVTAQNNMGGYVTDDWYIMLRINPALDGRFEYYTGSVLGYEYPYTDKQKEAFNWGVKPADFNASALLNKQKDAEVVPIKKLIAFPERYEGKYITVEEDFKIGSNYIKDKRFYGYPLNEDGRIIFEATLYIYYTYVENFEECIMSEEDQKFRVSGYVKTYADSTDVYIDADVIEFIK